MRRNGAALFEALVALVLVSLAGTSVAGRVLGLAHQRRLLETREAELDGAEQLLASAVQGSADDLERGMGLRTLGSFAVLISRPEPTVYRVAVSLMSDPERELLATLVHRPAPAEPDVTKEPAR